MKTYDSAYRIIKSSVDTLKSTPYIFQKVRPRPQPKNLMLGFSRKVEGWTTFDVMPGADYLGSIKNLKLFADDTVDKVYASHVLEHVNGRDAKTALKEIHRILKPGGEVFLAVPDMVNISKLLETEFAETAINIVYGVNPPNQDWHPQHMYGYTKTLLEKLLLDVGFISIEEFEPFLDDTTQFYVGGIKVSLCLKGRKNINT